jgi:hypothetical protein
MTKEAFEKAYIITDRIAKLKAIKEKIKREFPEFEYDTISKEIGNSIFEVLDSRIKDQQKEFDSL